MPFNNTWISLLNSIFDESNIYNYSGKKDYTEDIYNYYEAGRYRPNVVLDII